MPKRKQALKTGIITIRAQFAGDAEKIPEFIKAAISDSDKGSLFIQDVKIEVVEGDK